MKKTVVFEFYFVFTNKFNKQKKQIRLFLFCTEKKKERKIYFIYQIKDIDYLSELNSMN